MMRRAPTAVWVGLLISCPLPLAAQISLYAALGARYNSTLVHDSIVTPLDVRTAIGPALALAADSVSPYSNDIQPRHQCRGQRSSTVSREEQ